MAASRLNTKAGGNRADGDTEENASVCNSNTNMSPLVWQQFWKRKCGQLAIPATKADERHAGNELLGVVRQSCDQEANEDDDVASDDEIPSAEQVRICTTDHEGCHNGDLNN